MKPNIGLKKHENGKLVLIHLKTGEILSGLHTVELLDNAAGDDCAFVHAKIHLKDVRTVDDDYQPPKQPEPKSSGSKLTVEIDIDTQPFRESLRLLGEDLIKMAGKS